MKKFLHILLALLLGPFSLFAQSPDQVEMADLMRSNGKIYVVVATIVIVFIGFFIYLIRIDRKVSQIEKDL